MIITVKANDNANKSDETPYLNAIAEVKETTNHECTDGIPPLHRAFEILTSHVFAFIINPFTNTVIKKVIAGISNKCS
jgi:hypothetical protein